MVGGQGSFDIVGEVRFVTNPLINIFEDDRGVGGGKEFLSHYAAVIPCLFMITRESL